MIEDSLNYTCTKCNEKAVKIQKVYHGNLLPDNWIEFEYKLRKTNNNKEDLKEKTHFCSGKCFNAYLVENLKFQNL